MASGAGVIPSDFYSGLNKAPNSSSSSSSSSSSGSSGSSGTSQQQQQISKPAASAPATGIGGAGAPAAYSQIGVAYENWIDPNKPVGISDADWGNEPEWLRYANYKDDQLQTIQGRNGASGSYGGVNMAPGVSTTGGYLPPATQAAPAAAAASPAQSQAAVDYQALINQAAAAGDRAKAAEYERLRNAKIDALNAAGQNTDGWSKTYYYQDAYGGTTLPAEIQQLLDVQMNGRSEALSFDQFVSQLGGNPFSNVSQIADDGTMFPGNSQLNDLYNLIYGKMAEGAPDINQLLDQDALTWEQAQARARQTVNPQYQQALDQAMQGLTENALVSGFYGQLPTEALKLQTQGQLEGDRIMAQNQLAEQLQAASKEDAYRKYEAMTDQQKTQLNSLLEMLGLSSSYYQDTRDYNASRQDAAYNQAMDMYDQYLKQGQLTGSINGVPTTDYLSMIMDVYYKNQNLGLSQQEIALKQQQMTADQAALAWEQAYKEALALGSLNGQPTLDYLDYQLALRNAAAKASGSSSGGSNSSGSSGSGDTGKLAPSVDIVNEVANNVLQTVGEIPDKIILSGNWADFNYRITNALNVYLQNKSVTQTQAAKAYQLLADYYGIPDEYRIG